LQPPSPTWWAQVSRLTTGDEQHDPDVFQSLACDQRTVVYRSMSDDGRSLEQSPEQELRAPAQEVFQAGAANDRPIWAIGLALGLIVIALGTVFFAFRWIGYRVSHTPLRENWKAEMEVTGASMAPTLWGQHAEIVCPGCAIRWNANWQLPFRPSAAVSCWNCGADVTLEGIASQSGDRVKLCQPLAPAPLMGIRPGDLVAIEEPGQAASSQLPQDQSSAINQTSSINRTHNPRWTVKRLFAMPGESIAHRQGFLVVEPRINQRAEKPNAAVDVHSDTRTDPTYEPVWVTVHDDRFRHDSLSWWRPTESGPAIGRGDKSFSLVSTASPPLWLVYHHFAVHRDMRPDVIRDDVAGNLNETRLLVPVERIRLTMTAETALPSAIEVVMQIGNQTRSIRHNLSSGKNSLVFDSAAGELRASGESAVERAGVDPAPASTTMPITTATTPIAVRVVSGAAVISELIVQRPLEYRIAPRFLDRWQWPLQLGDDEYFVLGDNVPLSIDSRHWGPISRQRIVGRICPVGYDEQQR